MVLNSLKFSFCSEVLEMKQLTNLLNTVDPIMILLLVNLDLNHAIIE